MSAPPEPAGVLPRGIVRAAIVAGYVAVGLFAAGFTLAAAGAVRWPGGDLSETVGDWRLDYERPRWPKAVPGWIRRVLPGRPRRLVSVEYRPAKGGPDGDLGPLLEAPPAPYLDLRGAGLSEQDLVRAADAHATRLVGADLRGNAVTPAVLEAFGGASLLRFDPPAEDAALLAMAESHPRLCAAEVAERLAVRFLAVEETDSVLSRLRRGGLVRTVELRDGRVLPEDAAKAVADGWLPSLRRSAAVLVSDFRTTRLGRERNPGINLSIYFRPASESDAFYDLRGRRGDSDLPPPEVLRTVPPRTWTPPPVWSDLLATLPELEGLTVEGVALDWGTLPVRPKSLSTDAAGTGFGRFLSPRPGLEYLTVHDYRGGDGPLRSMRCPDLRSLTAYGGGGRPLTGAFLSDLRPHPGLKRLTVRPTYRRWGSGDRGLAGVYPEAVLEGGVGSVREALASRPRADFSRFPALESVDLGVDLSADSYGSLLSLPKLKEFDPPDDGLPEDVPEDVRRRLGRLVAE